MYRMRNRRQFLFFSRLFHANRQTGDDACQHFGDQNLFEYAYVFEPPTA